MGVAIFIISVFIAFMLWACCKSGAVYDRESEEAFNKGERTRMSEKQQRAYEDYRRKFAHDNGLTIWQATEYQAVKNYKEYLEAEHGVVIKESRCRQ